MSIRHATLHQLKVFSLVAEQGSFVRAAEALHLTPPAVSIQVRQLAEAVGAPLFEQVGKRIYLTEAGRVVAAGARDVLHRLSRIGDELQSLQGLEQGFLRLAILTTAQFFIPRWLGHFCRQHPGIEASLFVGNREQVMQRLTRHEDDLYIVGQPPEKIQAVAQVFAPNDLVLVAAAGHPWQDRSSIKVQALDQQPFILREVGSGTRLVTETFFTQHGIKPLVRMELGSNEVIKQAVIGGLGLAILSEQAVQAEIASGSLVRLDLQGLPLKRQWYVAWPSERALSPAAAAFVELLMQPPPALAQAPSV